MLKKFMEPLEICLIVANLKISRGGWGCLVLFEEVAAWGVQMRQRQRAKVVAGRLRMMMAAMGCLGGLVVAQAFSCSLLTFFPFYSKKFKSLRDRLSSTSVAVAGRYYALSKTLTMLFFFNCTDFIFFTL